MQAGPNTKMLLADVDGTTVRPDTDGASGRVQSVLRDFLEEGNIFVPVTSRTAKMMGRLAAQLDLEHMGVLDGGATMYDFARKARDPNLSRWLKPGKVREIIDAIGGLCPKIYYGPNSDLHRAAFRLAEDSPSVFAVYPNEATHGVRRALLEIAGVQYHENFYEDAGTHSCVQVVCDGVSKASGTHMLRGLPPYSAILPQNIMVAGDGKPDLDLFAAAPSGAWKVAVGDRNKELREAADFVAPDVKSDGLAVAVEKFMSK
jgi:hydroxymethylpyrimidine pyrophosphatase-like HAD family hydrolase